jgi:hypothetical protein
MVELGERAEASKDPVAVLNANADLLIRGCQAVLGRDFPGDEPTPQLGPDGEPYKIDHNLAQALGMPESSTARQVLLKLFSGVPSPDLAIGSVAGDYMTWARGANEEVGQEVLGESQAGG